MITRLFVVLFVLLQCAVASPPQQLLLTQKTAASGTPAIANVWKAVGNFSATLAVTVSPSAGSCLVVAVPEYGSTADNTGMSDDIGSTTGWTKITRVVNGGVSLVWWYKANIPAGITTVTLTTSTDVDYYNAHVFEITGANTSTPFTSGEVATASGTGSTGNSGTVTTATANSVLIAMTANNSSSNPEVFTLNASGTSGGTWALFNSAAEEPDAVSNLASSVPSLVVSSTAARIHYWSYPASRIWAGSMIAIH